MFKNLTKLGPCAWIREQDVLAVIAYDTGWTHFYLKGSAKEYISLKTEFLLPEVKKRFGIE